MDNITLKHLRKNAKLTQAELAVLMGVSRDVIINMENGHTKISGPKQKLLEQIILLKKSGDLQHSTASKEVILTEKMPHLGENQLEMAVMTNLSTSSASLELICEILSCVKKESLDQVKARAQKLTSEKARSIEQFLAAIF